MSILQAGFAKSGNSWLYNIIQRASSLGGVTQTTYIKDQPIYPIARNWIFSFPEQVDIDTIEIDSKGCSYVIGKYHRQKIADFDAYLQKASHVWTHSSYCAKQVEVYRKFSKFVYIVRDPRDVALSMSKFAFTDYMAIGDRHRERSPSEYLDHRLYGGLLNWVSHVAGYLGCRQEHNVKIVFYENLLNNFDQEVSGLLDYLNIGLTSQQFLELKQSVSFKHMKINRPNHLREGKYYSWIAAMSGFQKEQSLKIVGPLLSLLGYPEKEPVEMSVLPRVPRGVDSMQLAEIVKTSRGSFFDKVHYLASFLESKRSIRDFLSKGYKFIIGG